VTVRCAERRPATRDRHDDDENWAREVDNLETLEERVPRQIGMYWWGQTDHV
jgi:hypothetical protein